MTIFTPQKLWIRAEDFLSDQIVIFLSLSNKLPLLDINSGSSSGITCNTNISSSDNNSNNIPMIHVTIAVFQASASVDRKSVV